MKFTATRLGLGAAFALSALASAQAGPTTLSDPVFSIIATNASGTGTYTANFADGFYFPDDGGIFFWSGGGTNLVDPNNNNVVATFDQGGISVLYDPVIGMTFAVTAGSTDTTFTITSALVSFSPIINPVAYATGSIGATNVSGTTPGGALTGLFAGGNAYLTQYNGYVPGGTTFATQCPSIVFAGSEGNGPSENTGNINLVGAVSNMSSQIKFTLSAGDRANGTVDYSIKPEPGTLALLAIGALAAARRRA